MSCVDLIFFFFMIQQKLNLNQFAEGPQGLICDTQLQRKVNEINT